MAQPHLALRPTGNGLDSHYAVAGSKNPLVLAMGSVNSKKKCYVKITPYILVRGEKILGESSKVYKIKTK